MKTSIFASSVLVVCLGYLTAATSLEQPKLLLASVKSKKNHLPVPPTKNSPRLPKRPKDPKAPKDSKDPKTSKKIKAPKTEKIDLPSQAPTSFEPEFKGLDNIYSVEKGVIELSWSPPTFIGPFSEDETVYDIFVAVGDFDFSEALTTSSVEKLIEAFGDEAAFDQHLQIIGEQKITINCENYGEIHTVLVTAQLGGVYSSNTRPTKVTVAVTSPKIRDDVTIVGLFVPTLNVDITVTDYSSIQNTVKFFGSVAEEAQSLVPGIIITGFSSDIVPFIRRVVTVTRTSPELVELVVDFVPINELYSDISIDGSFEASTKFGALDARRRLDFFGSIGAFFNDVGTAIKNVIVGAVDVLADIVNDIGDTLAEFFDLIAGGEKSLKYSLLDVHNEFTKELNPEAPGTFTLNGLVKMEANLVVSIQVIAIVVKKARVGFEASYIFESTLEFNSAKIQLKEEVELWKGKKKIKVFMVGVVPVQMYWEPKLNLGMSGEVSASAKSSVGITLQGGTDMYVNFDLTNGLSTTNTPPTLVPAYIFQRPDDAEAGVKASIALVLSADCGIYEGLLEANLGVSVGLGMEVAIGIQAVNLEPLPSLRKFDFNIEFAIPYSASVFGGKVVAGNIYETTWPIITLPKMNLEILEDLKCTLGSENGSSGNLASLSLIAKEDYSKDAILINEFTGDSIWYYEPEEDGWAISDSATKEVSLERSGPFASASPPKGNVIIGMKPKIPPIPLNILSSISLEALLDGTSEVKCLKADWCKGDEFFDALATELGAEFNSQIFLSQPPELNASPVPSTVYKFEDFMTALKKLQQAGDNFKFWLGDDCTLESQKVAMVNMAAFLGQSMRESIIYDACDENNWDKWRAILQETSESQTLADLYPMSSGCGQLGQRYAEYDCDDACPQDPSMSMTATTNAAWSGAPPPLMCGPTSQYDGLGYWNSEKYCTGTNVDTEEYTCKDSDFYYDGQTRGVHVPVSEDSRFPEFFYTNPLPDATGFTPAPMSPDQFPATNVEGCCWWGRGIIQTTGRCNFGKLNKQLGAGAGESALYPEINFCQNPQAICNGPSDLKWVAGIFSWVSDPQVYDRDGFNYKQGVEQFVEKGCADDLEMEGCDFLFEYASGILNRGCHDPGTTGCPGCVPGETCGPAHHVPERVDASKKVLRALMRHLNGDNIGDIDNIGSYPQRSLRRGANAF